MAHKIIEFLASIFGFIGFLIFIIAFFIVAMDVIEVYLKFREHVRNGDLAKRKDGK